jgi:hypothetical protein
MSSCSYYIIVTAADGEKLYVEAFDDAGMPKLGPRRLAMKAGFNAAVGMADQIRVARPDLRDICVSEVRD